MGNHCIRIVPEWNVKTLVGGKVEYLNCIRIVPEWNVKFPSTDKVPRTKALESYQSGM